MLARVWCEPCLFVRLVEQSPGPGWSRVRYRVDAGSKMAAPELGRGCSVPGGTERPRRVYRLRLSAPLRSPVDGPCRSAAWFWESLFRRPLSAVAGRKVSLKERRFTNRRFVRWAVCKPPLLVPYFGVATISDERLGCH